MTTFRVDKVKLNTVGCELVQRMKPESPGRPPAPALAAPPTGLALGVRAKLLSSEFLLCLLNGKERTRASLTSTCYFSLPQKYLEPVYFYIYTLFGLQAIYVTALYVTSWLLSGTWLAGLLAASWYVTNR